MQSFGAFYNDNRTFAIAVGVAVLAVVLLYAVYRLLFGRRLRMANGRSRQPRLGVVDAYDVDRQRQLVLVRRDNVEHLIMIGGPNDLLIESAIIRAQPSAALPGVRDREGSPPSMPLAGVAPQAPSLVGTSSGDAQPPLIATGAGADQKPAGAPVASVSGAVEAARPDAASGTPEPDDQPPAIPPRPAYVPRTPFQPRSPGIGAAAGTTPGASRLPPLRTPGTPPAPRPPSTGPRPTPAIPLSRGTSAASLRREPLPGSPMSAAPPTQAADGGPGNTGPGESPAPEAPPLAPNLGVRPSGQAEPAAAVGTMADTGIQPSQPVSLAEPPPRTLPTNLNTLESLEEEMAKLLGRPTAPTGKPD